MILSVVQHSKNCWKSLEICKDNTPFNFRQPVLQLEITHKGNCSSLLLLVLFRPHGCRMKQHFCFYWQSPVRKWATQIARQSLWHWHRKLHSRQTRKGEKKKEVVVGIQYMWGAKHKGDWLILIFVYLMTTRMDLQNPS